MTFNIFNPLCVAGAISPPCCQNLRLETERLDVSLLLIDALNRIFELAILQGAEESGSRLSFAQMQELMMPSPMQRGFKGRSCEEGGLGRCPWKRNKTA